MFKKLLTNPKKNVSWAIFLLIGILVLIKGADYYPDSYAFLRGDFNRSPVYSSFLKIFNSIFGDGYEYPVIIVQYTFIVIAVNYLVTTVKSVFEIKTFGAALIQLVLLAPCVYLHFVAGRILSEALSYPLLLIVFTLLFKAFITLNPRYINKTFITVFVLILTRGQFIVVIPVMLLLWLYIGYKTKTYRKHVVTLALIIVLPLFASFAERAYNKLVFGYFVNNTMNYVHLITSGFYLSDAEDVELFKTEDEKAYFNLVRNSLYEAELTRKQVIESGMDDSFFYEHNFSKICNERIHELGLTYFEGKGLNFYEQNIALNQLCSGMIYPLLKTHFKTWLKFFYKNLKNTFGSSKQMLLMLLLLIFAVVQLYRTNNKLFKFMLLATLLMFANNTLIAFAVHPIKRYVFYFDWVLFVIIILLLIETSKKQLNER